MANKLLNYYDTNIEIYGKGILNIQLGNPDVSSSSLLTISFNKISIESNKLMSVHGENKKITNKTFIFEDTNSDTLITLNFDAIKSTLFGLVKETYLTGEFSDVIVHENDYVTTYGIDFRAEKVLNKTTGKWFSWDEYKIISKFNAILDKKNT